MRVLKVFHGLQAVREVAGTLCLGWMATSLVILPLAASDGVPEKPGRVSSEEQSKWNVPLPEDEKILQLLNRITFGPRPGDVEMLREIGIDAFLDQQLHPDRIDDSAVEGRVAALPTLAMTSEELAENYPEMKQAQREAAAHTSGAVSNGKRRGALLDQKGGAMDEASRTTGQAPQPMQTQMQGMAEMQGPRRVIMELAQEEVLRAIYGQRQLQEVMVQFWMNHFNIFAPKGADKWLMTSFERDTIRPRALGKFEDLLVATAESPAMLFYLDNWMSVTPNPTYAGNFRGHRGRPAPYGGRWKPFGWGRWRRFGSSSDNRFPTRLLQNGPKKQNKRGLNENYGRELMELHTLGVGGGYTQDDVIEVARCLTGWTIDRPKQGGEFIFNPRLHDFGEKLVLGHKIRSGQGVGDGLQVLHILAHHPSTARFISHKLCRRFVADDPPQSLVDRASQTFLRTEGDIRAVLENILTSPEFYSRAAYRTKVKSPLELVASSMRALQAETDASVPLLQLIARMGQPMFQYQAPTGFPDRASTWINSSSLLMRMNFATMLASNRIRGTQVDWKEFGSAKGSTSPETVLTKLDQQLLERSLLPETREAILQEFDGGSRPATGEAPKLSGGPVAQGGSGVDLELPEAIALKRATDVVSAVAALVVASPEFQRR